MGLDNIPREYPCEHDHGVDMNASPHGEHCNSMKNQGKCPWAISMAEAGTPIYGMLGLDCWYRGKSGNWMLDKLRLSGHVSPLDFYGNDEDGISTEDCLELAEWMADHAEKFAYVSANEPNVEADIEEYRYAINWLKFVAPYGGSEIWY